MTHIRDVSPLSSPSLPTKNNTGHHIKQMVQMPGGSGSTNHPSGAGPLAVVPSRDELSNQHCEEPFTVPVPVPVDYMTLYLIIDQFTMYVCCLTAWTGEHKDTMSRQKCFELSSGAEISRRPGAFPGVPIDAGAQRWSPK